MKKGVCLEYIRKELLAETAKYLEPMNLTPETAPGAGEGGWISFVEASAVAETERAIVAEKPAEDASVNVLTFDESTGLQLKNQVEFAAAQATPKVTPVELPWKL